MIKTENGDKVPVVIKKEELLDDSKESTGSIDSETTSPGKLVIINLQKTRFDNKATMVVHHYIDRIMELVCEHLGVQVPDYDPAQDPTNSTTGIDLKEWKR